MSSVSPSPQGVVPVETDTEHVGDVVERVLDEIAQWSPREVLGCSAVEHLVGGFR
jgi:hypothetical protein